MTEKTSKSPKNSNKKLEKLASDLLPANHNYTHNDMTNCEIEEIVNFPQNLPASTPISAQKSERKSKPKKYKSIERFT